MPQKSSIAALRQQLHRFPELSGQEKQTAKIILDYLEKLKPASVITGLGNTGILAEFDSGKPGENVLFRAELDALPIQEVNDFEHRSTIQNVSHKCGHDGHMAMLCGLADELVNQGIRSGKVYLLFQPAEETGEGAKAVLDDLKFPEINFDYVFALHNLPGYPEGEIVIKEGSFTASVNSLILKLSGKTAHAAEPEHGLNPALAMSEIIQKSLALDNNFIEKEDFAVVTPVHAILGSEAYGTSAGYAEVHFTLRCWNDADLHRLEQKIIQLSEKTAQKHYLQLSYNFTQTFYANQNNPEAVKLIQQAAQENNYRVQQRDYPFKWGEDFGLFTSRFPGAMFGLGSGQNCPALHNPDYDFPDQILNHGINMFYGILKQIWQQK